MAAVAALVVLGVAVGALAFTQAPGPLSPRITDAQVRRVAATAVSDATTPVTPAAASGAGSLVVSGAVRSVDAYRGFGTWVDAFDYSPPYTGPTVPVGAASVDAMAALGVKTIFLQAGRIDTRSPGLLEDRWLIAEMVLRAHQRGLRVVGWYLPKWDDGTADMDHLKAIADFSVLGHRFDGIAVDIEYNADKHVPAERSRRLVALSTALRAYVGPDVALGAIVMPPVVLEVINKDYWPNFPWREIAALYDVWLPMSYWSNRTTKSGFKDGYAYNEENTRRLRTDLGLPEALVHAIGGIGTDDGVNDPPHPEEPHAVIGDLDGFLRSLRDTKAIGGSIYDWLTTAPGAREKLRTLLGSYG